MEKTRGGREGAEVHVLWLATMSSCLVVHRGHGGHGDLDYGLTLGAGELWQ